MKTHGDNFTMGTGAEFPPPHALGPRPALDLIEQMIKEIAASPEGHRFMDLLLATSDTDSLEGSCIADDLCAASMIRDKAKEMGDFIIADMKLWPLVLKMRIVLRRFGLGRTARKRIEELADA